MTANVSAEDVKDKLFHSLKTRGVLDSLKSQLRNQLIRELQDTTGIPVLHSKLKATTEEESDGISSFERAANIIVAEYLKICHFEYTLSTFLPESGTSLDKMFSSKDVLHLLNIDPKSNLYINLERSLSSTTDSKGFLWNFLREVVALQSKVKCDVNIQTDDSLRTQISSSLEQKLSSVEKKYSERQKLLQLDKNQGLEEKLKDMQKKYELQKKNELEEEVKRFKASELSRLKMEEREKHEAKIKIIRQEYDEEFNIKNQALRALEKEMLDRVKRLQEVHQSEAYAERQKFLEEMRSFKEREAELTNRTVIQERSQKLEEERLMLEVEKLKAREHALKEKEKLQAQRFNSAVESFKSDNEKQYSARNEALLRRESRLEAESSKLDRQREEYEKAQDELATFREKCFQLQSSNEASKLLLEDMKTQKHALERKLAEMKDYHTLKEKEAILSKDIEHLTQRLTETNLHYKEQEKKHQKLIKDLKEKTGKPSKEVAVLQQVLKDSKEKYKAKEQSLYEAQKTMETQLEAQIARANHFQKICEEQLNSQRLLETEIKNLKMMQEQTERLLSMELRHQNASNSNMSFATQRKHNINKTPTRRKVGQDVSMPRREVSTRMSTRRLEEEEISTMDESSLASIIEDKKSFEKFEKEAAALDASYRDFQSRMIIPSKYSVASIPSSMTFRRLASYHSLHSPLPSGMDDGSGGFTLAAQEEFRPLKQVYEETNHDEQSTTAKIRTSYKGFAKMSETPSQNEHPDQLKEVSYEESAGQSDSEIESGRLIEDESVALSMKELNSTHYQPDTMNTAGRTMNVLKSRSASGSTHPNEGHGISDKHTKQAVSKNTKLSGYPSNRTEMISGNKHFKGQNSSGMLVNESDEVFKGQNTLQAFQSVENALDQTGNRIAEDDKNSHNVRKAQDGVSGTATQSSVPGVPLKIRSEFKVSDTFKQSEEHKIDNMDDRKEENNHTKTDEEIRSESSSASLEKSSSHASLHDNPRTHRELDNSTHTREKIDIDVLNVSKRRHSTELDMEELKERRRRDTQRLQEEVENYGKKDTSSKNSLRDVRNESIEDISGGNGWGNNTQIATIKQHSDENNAQDPPIDPVMLKYMEMIKQRRENEVKTEEQSVNVLRADSQDVSDYDSRVSIGKDEDLRYNKKYNAIIFLQSYDGRKYTVKSIVFISTHGRH